MDVVTSDHVTKAGDFSFLYFGIMYSRSSASFRKSFFICFLIPQGYFHHLPICPHFKRLQVVLFLVRVVHVSHTYKSIDHTYAFIIYKVVCYYFIILFILMCRAVNVFNIELNAPLAISIQDFFITFSI